MRLNRWIFTLALGAALSMAAACGEKKAEESESAEGAEGTDAEKADESDASASEGGDDKKAAAEAPTPDKAGEKAGEKAESAGAESKTDEVAKGDGGVEAKLKEMGPEEEAAVTKRCGDAFDNTVNIMQTAGAPANIVAQMRKQREKTVASCLEQAKIDPSGATMIDCMLAARLPADIQTCTRKYGNIQPIKPPKGVGHDDH